MKKLILLIAAALFSFLLGTLMTARYFSEAKNAETTEYVQNVSDSQKKRSDWAELLRYENKDLRNLADEDVKNLTSVSGSLIKDTVDVRNLELFSKISNAGNESSYILIAVAHLETVPGNSELQIYSFDAQGDYRGKCSFSAGSRIDVVKVRTEYAPEINREIIEVESEPAINGRDIARQFYALIGARILPIRLEADDKKAVRNHYDNAYSAIGLNAAGRSAEDWKNSLKSSDPAELLASLLWLNGKHKNQGEPPDKFQENSEETATFWKVKNDEEVKNIVANLTKSKNRWLRQNADLTGD